MRKRSGAANTGGRSSGLFFFPFFDDQRACILPLLLIFLRFCCWFLSRRCWLSLCIAGICSSYNTLLLLFPHLQLYVFFSPWPGCMLSLFSGTNRWIPSGLFPRLFLLIFFFRSPLTISFCCYYCTLGDNGCDTLDRVAARPPV